jgi:hypothetical protein
LRQLEFAPIPKLKPQPQHTIPAKQNNLSFSELLGALCVVFLIIFSTTFMIDDHTPKEIDISQIDLEKMKEKTTENPGLLPYAHTVGGAVVKPEDEGKIKGRAIQAMQEQTTNQMKQLYEQMQTLAKQAQDINRRIEISNRIYVAEMRFEPLIGKIYYLYQKNDGTDTLSLVAPNEWGRSAKYHHHIATAKLLADHTWEILD